MSSYPDGMNTLCLLLAAILFVLAALPIGRVNWLPLGLLLLTLSFLIPLARADGLL